MAWHDITWCRKATKAEKNMMAAWKYATVRLLITMPVTGNF